MNTVLSLRNIYATLGGALSDAEKIDTVPGMLDAINSYLADNPPGGGAAGGSGNGGDGVTVVHAHMIDGEWYVDHDYYELYNIYQNDNGGGILLVIHGIYTLEIVSLSANITHDSDDYDDWMSIMANGIMSINTKGKMRLDNYFICVTEGVSPNPDTGLVLAGGSSYKQYEATLTIQNVE